MNDYAKKWKFAIEAYEGSGGFDDGSYIDRYPREGEDKYLARQKMAYYSNIFGANVNRYIGYIYKDRPIRTTKNPLIQKIFDDANNKGDSIDVFISSFAKRAKVRGVGLVLVDMPKELPKSFKEQLEQRALPYFVEIAPESVVEYKMDRFGKFEYIKYKDTLDLSTPKEQKVIPIERYYDKNRWIVYAQDDILEQGSHNLGVCPVLYFGENGVFPDIGEFTNVAKIAKRHYNLESELDEILRSQTFSILTIQAQKPSDFELRLSTDNAIIYGEGMTRPSFISPESSPANSYEKRIEKLEHLIDKITYNFTTNQAQESGIALEIKFQGLNSSLANFAMRLEDFEARIFDVACRYLNIQNDIAISYKKEFSISDITQEIATLEEFKNLGYNVPTYERLKLERIIANDLASIDVEDLDKIRSEIEDGMK